jgi:ligand-binding sensor domain-containing protein/signal transduction histidine kinase/DNA-binding response OmpR family regulator
MLFFKTFFKKNNTKKAVFKHTFSFLFFTFCLSAPAIAQKNNFSFDHFTVESGLSQSSVISIAQDSMGFMWFGTKDGLNRYDSRRFEVFKNNSKDSTSISSNQNINALLTDSNGDLWIGTQDGLNKYLSETKSFTRFFNKPNDKFSLSNNTIRCLYEDKEGNLWVGTENGLNKFSHNGKFERFLCKGSLGSGIVNPIVKAICEDDKGDLWVGTQFGLAVISKAYDSYNFQTYYHNDADITSISDNDINAIAKDKEGNLWIGTHFKGISKKAKSGVGFTHFNSTNSGLINNIIRKILVDKQGKLWFATINGISVYDPAKNEFQNQFHNPEVPNSLNQNSIYDIFQDRAGSVWAGTYYGGVNVYHPNAVSFQIYKHYSYRNSLSSNVISALKEDKFGNLWIGTEAEGLNYYDRDAGTFYNLRAKGGKNSLSSNLIKAISIDQKDNLWIAAYEGGVDYYDTQTRQFKNYDISDGKSLSLKRITYLLADWEDKLWVGTKGKGLFLFDKQTNAFRSLQKETSKFHLSALNIVHIYQDRENTVWVATDEGLFFLRQHGREFVRLMLKNSTYFNQVSFITEATNGEMLFGTCADGVALYNPKSRKAKIYTIKDGLPSNNIAGIVEDNQHRVWVSTDKGLAFLSNNGIKIYNRNDGLPGNVFNAHSVLKDSKGALFFGGYNGLVSFFPADISANTSPPKIVFTHLRLFNKEIPVKEGSSILPKSLNKLPALVLDYQQNVFSVEFSALNFVKSRKNKYAYKLQGFENGWNEVTEPTAVFTNLPDGTYNLLVKGSNNDGVFNTVPASLKIIIKPPLWRTWWAYLIYALAFIALLYLVMRFLLIRALLKREHDVHQMKLDFFTNVSHEIRTPLTLILGPLEKMIQDTHDNFGFNKQLLTINKNAKRLMRLVNELMDFRKIESGKMKLNLSANNIVSFVNEIYLSFQQLAVQNRVDYTFTTAEEDIQVYFDKEQLEKVIFNLLSNAFKFTAQKNAKVGVEISHQNQHVFIKINDNGEGISEEDKAKLFTAFYQAPNQQQRNVGTGIGLALSKSIAKLHHGDLVLQQSGNITTFCLSLMTGKLQYKDEEINLELSFEESSLYQINQHHNELLEVEPIKKTSIVSNLPLLLVVDDNPEVKEFIVNTLTPFYQVIAASNGKEALALAFEKIPDVIISDVMMPEMDGFEFCAKLKTDSRTSHIPVVLLTARSSELHELEGLKTGADVYLTKPFGTKKLRLIVDNLITLHQHMREKFSQTFSLQPTEVKVQSADEEFLNKVMALLEDNISNTEFNVNLFASEIGMSTPVFYKKIDALTGLTVNNFIKSVRLKRAFQLLQQKAGNISEIAYMVGFNDAKYFSKEFKKQYGKSPSEFV